MTALDGALRSAAEDDVHSRCSPAWQMMMDQLDVMVAQEETNYGVHQSIHPPRQDGPLPFAFSDGGDLDVCRRKMCEWAFNVVDYFDYSRDLVSVSLNHVDRYIAVILAAGGSICKRRFQSISVTALYMTLKVQGMSAGRVDAGSGRKRLLSIRTFVELSRGILSVESLEEEERRMLHGLGYLLNPPTPVKFVEQLVPLLLQNQTAWSTGAAGIDARTLHYIYELARYFTELAVFELDLSTSHKSSCIAFASLLNAMDAMDSRAFPFEAKKKAVNAAKMTPLNLSTAEVEDARALLSRLCPLEALEWPGNESAGASGHLSGGVQGNGSNKDVSVDDISQESPTSVRNFLSGA